MQVNGWVKIIDAPSPKTSKKDRIIWCQELEGTVLKNGVICIANNKKK